MTPFKFKTGDSRPLVVTLTPDTNVNGASVVFNMRARDGAVVISRRPMVIEQPSPARVRLDWQTGDTATAGVYEFEIEVTFADGRVMTWPSVDYWPLIIEPDIA